MDTLIGLKQLYFDNNLIKEINGLGRLSELTHLDISDNLIKQIKGLDELAQLIDLKISYNEIKEITGLDRLSQLTSLDVSNNEITEIKGLDNLPQISILSLWSNKITEIKGLSVLGKLTNLDITNNQITEFQGLDGLHQLTHLNISGNEIIEIKNLDGLHQLTHLNISENEIAEIQGLEGLPKLINLNIWGNKITEIKGLHGLPQLSKLDISGNQISEIQGLEGLTQLTYLDIGMNNITEIKGLDGLSKLTNLVIWDNKITEIKGLHGLLQLSRLDISDNKITEIQGLEGLSKLDNLDISDNKITEIKGLEGLHLLTYLTICNNKIVEIKGLERLSHLTNLDVSDNKITEINGLGKLPQLTKLNLSGNQITAIKGLDCLPQLTYLNIRNNKISEIKGLDGLPQLKILIISANEITEISGLEGLHQLSRLDICDNVISEIKGLDDFPQLVNLDVSGNNIIKIGGLEGLHKLTHLNLSENYITEIKGLDEFLQLIDLDISNNRITEIKGLDGLTQLTDLNISNNLISVIKGMSKLTQLEKLNLSSNKIGSVRYIRDFLSLTDIILLNNPLKDVPQGLLGYDADENCISDLKNWWQETADPQTISENWLVKLQVIGNASAGKSSIIEALKHGRCEKNFLSTHGILIEHVRYPVNGEPVTFQAWDFGGQEIFHGTHKLFISSESVELIVTDFETERYAAAGISVPDRVITDQLVLHQPLEHYIELAGRQSPSSVLVIAENKTDVNNENENWIYTKAAALNFEFCKVSAIKGTGIEKLRLVLAEKGKELLHYGMLMPKSWLAVQQYFLDNLEMPFEDRGRIMSIAGFETICNRYKVMKGSEKSLLKLLHHTGLVYFNEETFKGKIITDQRWALDAIYKPLDRKSEFYDEMLKDYKGRVRAKKLFKIFGTQYTQEEKWLFLRFMQGCGLCFPLTTRQKEETEDNYFIFPQFLPENETPASANTWSAVKNVNTYRCRQNYLNYYKIQKFIVDVGNKTNVEYIWRNGLMVLTDKGFFRVTADKNNPSILIQIEAAAEDSYLWEIISSFEEINQTESKETWTIGIDIESKEVLDVNVLKNRAKEKSANQDNKNSRNEAKNTNPEQESEKVKTGLKENLKDVIQIPPKRLVISYASEDIVALDFIEMSLSNYEVNGELQIQYDKEVINGRRNWDADIEEMFNEADGYLILVSQAYQYVKKKKYIWENEMPIMEKRLKDEHLFTFCISVAPVDYNNRLAKIAAYKNGKVVMPESGNARAQFCIDFAKEIMENKFLKK